MKSREPVLRMVDTAATSAFKASSRVSASMRSRPAAALVSTPRTRTTTPVSRKPASSRYLSARTLSLAGSSAPERIEALGYSDTEDGGNQEQRRSDGHQPGRREVWYHLTEKGQDLRPVLEALLAWGLKYERHPLGEDEAAHPEHLLLGVSTALNQRAVRPGRPRVWRFEFGDEDGAFALVFDGEGWSVGNGDQPTDVVVRTTPRAWAEFITRPLAKRRLPSREIGLSGSEDRVSELVEAFGAERAGRPA
jgi:hypothetical protein